MASHRSLVSNVGVGLLALSVLVLGAQTNTAVMLASENQALVAAPGNEGKNDSKKNEEKEANPGNGSPGTPGNGSSGTPGNSSPGAPQPPAPAATLEPARGNPGAGGTGGNGTGGERKAELTVTPLPSPWPTPGQPGGGNPAQKGIHRAIGICHSTGNGYQYIEADDNSALYQGHLQHGGDKFNVTADACEKSKSQATDVPSPTATTGTPTPVPQVTPGATTPIVVVTPSATTTVAATSSATASVVAQPSPTTTQVAAEGTPTPVAEATRGPGEGNGRLDQDDDPDGGSDDNRPRSERGLSGGSEGESRGDTSQLRGEIALSPDLEGLPAEAYGPNGEVLSGNPGLPQRTPARQAVPAPAAGGGSSVAQLPSLRPAAPAVLPTTGEGGGSASQGLAALGMALFAFGTILTRIGRRAES